jgi:hypothetical protein
MSLRNATEPQDLGPERLKPDRGARTLPASVEARPHADLCTGQGARQAVRERVLVWLGEGAREVSWALCSLPRERWVAPPPARPEQWPALRHVRHLALRETHLTLPAVRHALGDAPAPSTLEFEQADAAWDAKAALESAEAIVRGLGEARFELLQQVESAPDEAWDEPLPGMNPLPEGEGAPAVQLDWLLLDARQHELEHLAAIWRISLNWDRVARTQIPGVLLHPADTLEESH